MRKITQESVNAFMAGKEFKKGNTTVEIKGTTKGIPTWLELKLHGNTIAELHKTENKTVLRITLAGYNTNTTKERLRGLGANITTKKGIVYLNGVAWDGTWKEI